MARQYLGANRIELDVLPGPPALASRRSDGRPVEAGAAGKSRTRGSQGRIRPLGHAPAWAHTPLRRLRDFERRTLSNGLELLIVERHELPIVTFDLIVKSGETSTPKGKEGLGSIAASLLDEGTKTRDSLQIAGELAEIGASLGAAGELESTTVSLTTLTRHLERALDLYADVILNPSFP